MRGPKEVKKLLKVKKGKNAATTAAEILETESEEDEVDEVEDNALTAREVLDQDAEMTYDDDDNASLASTDSYASRTSEAELGGRSHAVTAKLEIVIEDSEDDS